MHLLVLRTRPWGARDGLHQDQGIGACVLVGVCVEAAMVLQHTPACPLLVRLLVRYCRMTGRLSTRLLRMATCPWWHTWWLRVRM